MQDPIYCPENVPLYEAIYGKNLISLGGVAAIDNMFSDIDIKSLKALDVGFGLGGVAFYLAKKFKMDVTGIEIHAWMVEYANAQLPKELAEHLNFVVYDESGKMPLKPKSFDIVYSKGVLNHVEDKETLFHQVYSVLKSNGLFVIADWIYPEKSTDLSGPLVKETKETYQKILEQTGFNQIKFRDDSLVFVNYVNELLKKLMNNREFIEQKYGTEMFITILNDHQKLLAEIHHKRKFAVRIVASK